MKLIKKIFANPPILYVVSRYATYIIQFITSLFIAHKLGAFYLGIWGFISLVILYLSNIDLGVSSTITLLGSKRSEDNRYLAQLLSNILPVVGVVSAVAVLFLYMNHIYVFFGDKYDFNKYLAPIALVVVLNVLIPVLTGLARIRSEVRIISIIQVLQPLSMLFSVIFFSGETLLWALLWSYAISSLLSVILLANNLKNLRFVSPSIIFLKEIILRSIFLYIYTTAFYFILYSTRTVISDRGTVEQFGFFTFAFSLANVVTLLLKSFSFLIFPKVINRFSTADAAKSSSLLFTLRSTYITMAHFLMHILVFIFPLFILLFPQYEESIQAFNLILISTILYSNAMGYQGLLLAKDKERLIALLSFSALLLNIGLAYLFGYILNLSYQYIILATGISYFVYVLLLSYYGRLILNLRVNFFKIFNEVFPISIIIPYVISVILIFYKSPYIMMGLPLLFFVVLNFKNFALIFKMLKDILNNPKIVNI